MSLTKKRADYLRKCMEDSALWLSILKDQLAATTDDAEFDRLKRLFERETELYVALLHALEANQDTFAIF